MEMDQDYLRTGTAMGSRAFHEHQLRFLVIVKNEPTWNKLKYALLSKLFERNNVQLYYTSGALD